MCGRLRPEADGLGPATAYRTMWSVMSSRMIVSQ
mgnify:CR=1 FL=1